MKDFAMILFTVAAVFCLAAVGLKSVGYLAIALVPAVLGCLTMNYSNNSNVERCSTLEIK